MAAKAPHRPNPCSPLRLPSHQKVVMAAAAMEAATVANQEMVVVMAAVHAAKAVVVVGAVDVAAVAQTARLAPSENASMPKASPCSPTPTCKAPTPGHKSRPGTNSALIGGHALSAATVLAVVASEMKAANVENRAQKAHRQSTQATRTSTMTGLPVNRVSPAKAVVDEAGATAAPPDRTVKRATQVVRAASPSWALRMVTTHLKRHQQTNRHPTMTAAL